MRHRPAATTGAACRRALRAGAALLEVLAALTVFVIAGLSAAGAISEAAHSLEYAIAAEQRLMSASRFMESVALWPADDYDRRLGERPQGPWILRIERTDRSLYVLALSDSSSPGQTLLETTVYRRRISSGHTSSTDVETRPAALPFGVRH